MTTPPVRLRGLDHIVIRTARLDEMLAFYRDRLGCTLVRVVDSIGLYQLQAGVSIIDLITADGNEPAGRNMDHFCLRVDNDDLQAVASDLVARGVTIEGDVGRRYGADGYGPSLYIRDPDDNVVELKGAPEPDSLIAPEDYPKI